MRTLPSSWPARSPRLRQVLAASAAVTTLLALWHFLPLFGTFASLATLPLTWPRHAESFYLDGQAEDLDVTFAAYNHTDTTAYPYADVVPPVLHHIVLGHDVDTTKWSETWSSARQACLDFHDGWEAHLWTDETASQFIQEKFPDMLKTWQGYKFPIQKIDALRYLVLYEYGGVVLDMDLMCKRSLGPLRRFGFVAPAAFPTGFSIGFMMASKRNPFVGELVRNLKVYDRHWLGLPYPTVMFSTGCHFASTIHALQRDRRELKILAGPKDNPKLHQLNGPVSTPLFDHLGSSSWHSYDAMLIVSIGKSRRLMPALFIAGIVIATIFVLMKRRKWRSLRLSEKLFELQS